MRAQLTSRLPIHPKLRGAAGETVRLFALLLLYAILLGLFALAALGIWTELPAAMLDSRLVPASPPAAQAEPVKLRGSL